VVVEVVRVVVSGSELAVDDACADVVVVGGGAIVVVLVVDILGTKTVNLNTRDRVTTQMTKTINAVQMILVRG